MYRNAAMQRSFASLRMTLWGFRFGVGFLNLLT
jgi:hypothetical protein